LRNIKFIVVSFITLSVGALSLQAASQLVFKVLGITTEDAAWSYLVALSLGFVASTVLLAIGILTAKNSWMSRMAIALSASTSSAWLGFYYGGIVTGGKNPQAATFAAVIAVIIMGVTSFYLRKRPIFIAVMVMGIAATYGLAFLCSAATFAFLSTNNFRLGIIWGSLCLGTVVLTIVFLNVLVREMATYLS
jgi:hypothetical protein